MLALLYKAFSLKKNVEKRLKYTKLHYILIESIIILLMFIYINEVELSKSITIHLNH